MKTDFRNSMRKLTYLLVVISFIFGNFNLTSDLFAKKSKTTGKSSSSGSSSRVTQIGTAGDIVSTNYHLSGFVASGDLSIVGPVTMVVDGDFDIGNHTIEIAAGGSLVLYVGGNISVNGNGGFNNTGVPSNLIVYGTHPHKAENESPDYSITLSGNGYLSGVVYAPNAEYRTNGGGNSGATLGSVVALDVVFNGSPGPFHYDVALSDFILPFGGYTMDDYALKKNGNYTPSTEVKAVIGNTTYDALFKSLF